MFSYRKKRRVSGEIDPDEVLIDARNLPEFETERFEGRLEKPISKQAIVGCGIVIFLVIVVFTARLFYLQVHKGEAFETLSNNNRFKEYIVFANRGALFDRNGVPLAWNGLPSPLNPVPPRLYSDVSGLAHIVGYAKLPQRDTSGQYYSATYSGAAGAEQFFDSLLTGKNGNKIVETDVHGNLVSEGVFKEPVEGRSITLSIDAALTHKMNQAIHDLAERVGFRGGAGVIMDVTNGEIIALTNYPEFDQSILSAATNTARITQYQNDKRSPFLNRAVKGLYTPGSIVKPFLALGALAEKIISPEKEILSTGALTIPNPYNPDLPTVFRDWKAHGYVDMRDAIAVSSNVYFFTVGGGFEDQKGLGIEKIAYHLKRFGFGSEVPGDFFAGEEGVVPDPTWKATVFPDEPWRLGDTYNTSIGQFGFQVTPVQAVRAVAALANNGTLLSPTIVLHGNDFRVGSSTLITIPPGDVRVVREGMRQGVLRGTAAALNIPDTMIAAKTGTAELGAKKEEVNSWVMGYFPYEKPRYAFVLLMERGPRANLYGAVVAMREVVEWMKEHAPTYLSVSP